MPERFAIYYAPATADPLWIRAAQWLGRDAASDAAPPDAATHGLEAERRRRLSESARRYGFHATLKAPMALRDGTTESQLARAVDDFVAAHRPVPIGPLHIALIEGFLALVPVEQTDALTGFAMACVAAFEPFRAPLTAADRQKRMTAGLSPRQAELLDAYGYPYVAEEFRFHMTLTDRLPESERTAFAEAAEVWFGPLLDRPHMLDRIALFHEPAPGAPFRRRADHLLGLTVTADA